MQRGRIISSFTAAFFRVEWLTVTFLLDDINLPTRSPMATSTPRAEYSKDQHAKQATGYALYEHTPTALLEHQLQDSALGDCKGITVLDLGGGQGLRARQVIDHGAIAVDVVDSEDILHLTTWPRAVVPLYTHPSPLPREGKCPMPVCLDRIPTDTR